MLDGKSKANLRRRMLKWFDTNQRDLPWRKKKSLYRIWVSEIMLQQTQVATVIEYYRRFMKRFPSVKSLASAEESEVLKLWEGLGYYRRARQMHSAAKMIVEEHRGKFPNEFDDVLALPGIGRYTAGAILSIALDQKQPILEGNTIRLFARLMHLQEDPKKSASQKCLWEFSESLLPNKRVGDFNQSLMELGAVICKPRNPDCPNCPIIAHCCAFKKGDQLSIPVASKKVKYERVREAVVLVAKSLTKNKDRQYLIRKCQAGERWVGLWDFPRFNIDPKNTDGNVITHLASELKKLTGVTGMICSTDVEIKHAVTRFRIELSCYYLQSPKGTTRKMKEDVQWATIGQLNDLPMSVTGRKIASKLAAGEIDIDTLSPR